MRFLKKKKQTNKQTKTNNLFLSFYLTFPFVANVFSVYAVRRERTQYKITAYIARVHVRGWRENWTVSNFLLTFPFNFRADCANGNYFLLTIHHVSLSSNLL